MAWNWVETFLNQEGGINLTWEELKTNMRHAFGQVDTKEITFEKFQKIQQGHRTAATYWAEFQPIKVDLPYADNVCIREILLASVHMYKNYHHSNRRMTFRLEESIEKFAR